jgi:hypothetical protein
MDARLENALAQLRGYLPLARPYIPHGAALLLFALLGWLNGYFQVTKSVNNPHLKDTWSLPTWAPASAGPEKEELAGLDIWDGQKSKSQKKNLVQDSKAWRLVGTVRTGKKYTAIVQIDGGRIQHIALGDVLPNGEKVTGVANGTLQIDNNGTQQEIKLFQPGDKDKLEKK